MFWIDAFAITETNRSQTTMLVRTKTRLWSRQRRHSCSVRAVAAATLFLLASSSCPVTVNAKRSQGEFQLSGAQTEVLMSSFAVLPTGASVQVTLTADTAYENERSLFVRAYRDTEWDAFVKEPLCSEKIKRPQKSQSVEFRSVLVDFADTKKMSRKVNDKPYWQATVNIEIPSLVDNPSEESRNHYWYFVIDDCSLEVYFHDNRIPQVHYDLSAENYRTSRGRRPKHRYEHPYGEDNDKNYKYRQPTTHLSADEDDLPMLHFVTLLWSSLIWMVLMGPTVWRMYLSRRSSTAAVSTSSALQHHSVHAAVLWVALAAALDGTSSLAELFHLARYHRDGIGSYTLDAVAAHCEALCDACLMLLLWSLAAGWTLPSSVVAVPHASTATAVQSFVTAWRQSPTHSLLPRRVGMALIVGHAILAQWGRVYDDEAESYHDFEHAPGRVLMAVRIVGGLLFVVALVQTHRASKGNIKLLQFYTTAGGVGGAWFAALPWVTWMCHFVPYHRRRPVVTVTAALLQCGCVTALAWLVTASRTVYHQHSRLRPENAATSSLTDQLLGSTPNSSSTTSTAAHTSDVMSRSSRNVGATAAWSWGRGKVRLD